MTGFNYNCKMRIPTQTEYNCLIDIAAGSNDVAHWRDMYSWVGVHTPTAKKSAYRNICGSTSPRDYLNEVATARDVEVGFRPAIEPLKNDTLLSDIKDGNAVIVGTLYMNDVPVKVPQNPTWDGDVADYIPSTKLKLKPALDDPDYQVQAIKCGNILVCDRCLLKNISYDDIELALYKRAKNDKSHPNCYLANDYMWIPTFRGGGEMWFAIKSESVIKFVGNDYEGDDPIEWFLDNFDYQESNDLLLEGLLEEAVPFTFCPDDDMPFDIMSMDNTSINAFIDVISGLLNEAGHTNASKYLDCLFEI